MGPIHYKKNGWGLVFFQFFSFQLVFSFPFANSHSPPSRVPNPKAQSATQLALTGPLSASKLEKSWKTPGQARPTAPPLAGDCSAQKLPEMSPSLLPLLQRSGPTSSLQIDLLRSPAPSCRLFPTVLVSLPARWLGSIGPRPGHRCRPAGLSARGERPPPGVRLGLPRKLQSFRSKPLGCGA